MQTVVCMDWGIEGRRLVVLGRGWVFARPMEARCTQWIHASTVYTVDVALVHEIIEIHVFGTCSCQAVTAAR
jgi:hypothetical protein